MKQESELLYPSVRNELALAAPLQNDVVLRNRDDAEYHATEEAWLLDLAADLIRDHAAPTVAAHPRARR